MLNRLICVTSISWSRASFTRSGPVCLGLELNTEAEDPLSAHQDITSFWNISHAKQKDDLELIASTNAIATSIEVILYYSKLISLTLSVRIRRG